MEINISKFLAKETVLVGFYKRLELKDYFPFHKFGEAKKQG
jgi:hypothetical protein